MTKTQDQAKPYKSYNSRVFLTALEVAEALLEAGVRPASDEVMGIPDSSWREFPELLDIYRAHFANRNNLPIEDVEHVATLDMVYFYERQS